MSAEWSLSSWKSKSIAQVHVFFFLVSILLVLLKLEQLPPLVMLAEIKHLWYQLGLVQWNDVFLLHAGNCAESFDACTQVTQQLILFLIMISLILIWGARVPVVRIGCIAGQYAKPKSSPTEIVNGKKVLSFRGDNVNGLDPNDRTPDPQRLLSAYLHSTATLNHVRGLLTSGFASLHHPRVWSSIMKEFEFIVDGLSDALDFSWTIGAERSAPFEQGGGRGTVGEVDFYTSHKGLILDYEEALTRPSPSGHGYYRTSAHFLWIGDRTRQLDGAYVEYFRGIRNPIGIKVGPSMAYGELAVLLDVVNPSKELGRITLISRDAHLPGHIEAVKRSGHPFVWICDPIHGNTLTSPTGYKTRHFSAIIGEITSCLRIHTSCGSRLGSISLEFTGELNDEGFSVTECLGGSMGLSEEQLGLRYQSFCDPRLNFEQSLDGAFFLSNHFKKVGSDCDVIYSQKAPVKGEKGGKNKDNVESEDDGEADEDVGTSKKGTSPPAV
ncbi:DAHP synthetase [Guyanagaster necrorhizus]|uniref:Phospho-2-dehydro-3-deoxyheptonate aldolase n=1 Tax=Guyanagaster necrorhizus TaxID=856835 RepID=A0A9P7VEN9_9AGAR|nr:DAHP synthetase [Guyanagaster necrorhizus MCA 3950]KAG7439217.1 DAHP synthetase [Guyanagaster necrorhizus MCA 3950]